MVLPNPSTGHPPGIKVIERIADVDAFPGHIPCDSASRSELVVPLYRGDKLIGVFDLDSPIPDRFDADDQQGLEAIAVAWLETLEDAA